ncbi:radical SAM/SPASM domain-containing protein [Actinomadura algeriensis]|uniref:MoaA/NifB/PqqE/SkfB family radical SAM enzyme n=1 Tax=Actinomadura algeriensis TaxID=1679523 RepID=A0ABR9JQ50_9ACTN|nr:radical SAM/SPASM domain-containing protein [Actinomadura algeriensis]MBE1532703.1 MoaA/NifB/PqqE/SkfB family radical SAM enzyme [Actinomadura algeriensis]
MTITTDNTPKSATPHMLWLDLTRKCQLSCTHCYNDSGPDGDHGIMTRDDWTVALDQAAVGGFRRVQLIGGEPTLHPDAADLVEHALVRGVQVEVYTNLVHVPDLWWSLYRHPGVSIATSYYSARADEHNTVTGRRSHARTRTNIAKAVRLGVRLRAGIVTFPGDGGEAAARAARRDLEALGVTDIRLDGVRPFGRAATTSPDPVGLCGRCGDGRASIGPDGTVSPCVFSTWMGVGDIRSAALVDIVGGAAMADATASIRAVARGGGCDPDQECTPGFPNSECNPRN